MKPIAPFGNVTSEVLLSKNGKLQVIREAQNLEQITDNEVPLE